MSGRANAVRSRGVPVGLGTLALIAALVLATRAEASQVHPFREVFGSAAQPALASPRGIAVDQATGDVLVMDGGSTPSIKRFAPDGTPAEFSALGSNVIDGEGGADATPQNGLGFSVPPEAQIAVDDSGTVTDGDIYVTQSFPSAVNVFSSDGSFLRQLSQAGTTAIGEVCGVAVDSSGAVYVGAYTAGIYKFVPSANPLADTDAVAHFSTTHAPCTLAAGAGPTAGSLFPADYLGPLSKIDSATGVLRYTAFPEATTTVSADPVSGHLYVASGAAVDELSAAGANPTSVSSIQLESNVQGVAVNGSTGDIYVSRSGGSSLEVFDGAVVTLPEASTAAVSANAGSTATLNGSVNPHDAPLTDCSFEYGETTAYDHVVPCAESLGAIGSGSQAVSVHADVSGLSFGTTYRYRLRVANGNGTVTGGSLSFDAAGPPAIVGEWAGGVTSGDATVSASVDANALDTSVELEWGPDGSYGNASGPIDAGGGSDPRTVSVPLHGLKPATTYHFRFVASNSASTTLGHPEAGADRTFTTYPSGIGASLPDGRAYELVSPGDKDGGEIGGAVFVGQLADALAQSAPTGDSITYASFASFGDAPSAGLTTQYLSSRTPGGWTTHSVAPPNSGSGGIAALFGPVSPYRGFAEDLSAGVIETSDALVAGAPPGFESLYVRGTGDGEYHLVTGVTPPTQTPETYELKFAGASRDFSHIVFDADDELTPGALPGARNVYEWVRGSGLRLVSVLPGPGHEPAGGAVAGDWAELRFAGDVSADGSRIFWSDANGQLYVREGGTTTVQVNASQRAVSLGDGIATFSGATRDGSRVFFTDTTPLTDAPDDNGGLYAYDVETHRLAALTPSSDGPPGVEGVVGAAEMGTRIYFVADAALAPGAVDGDRNLYLAEAGRIELVATLEESDGDDWAQSLSERTAGVAPDGEHIAFLSTASLTGYDNADASTGTPDAEVFLYDAGAQRLVCVSCNPSGARPAGPSSLPKAHNPFDAPRYVFSGGDRVFFNSKDALLPADTNHRQDVYEYENGALHLISSGTDPGISTLADASADGANVFFTTRARLAPQDLDESSDLYDARTGGGFPLPPAPAPCWGEACRGPLGSPPAPPAIATAPHAALDAASTKDGRRCRARQRKSRRLRRAAANRCPAPRARGRARGAKTDSGRGS